ncbi:MAG: hypothetical protein E4G99_09185, partial [Anaerolineales bacterium]
MRDFSAIAEFYLLAGKDGTRRIAHTLPREADPAIMRGMFKHLLRAMRPRQWIKNLLIFSALLFDQQLFSIGPFLRIFEGFLLLCLAASGVYLINDIVDAEQDRQHPK